MKAALFHEQGDVDVLRYEDVPDPVPSAGEVVIRVRAAALNRLDLRARQDRPEVFPMPHIGGLDVVGDVEALGPGVEGYRRGERVLVYPVIACGGCSFCRQGDNALCAEQRVFGFQTQGGFAEYGVVPASNLIRLPSGADPVRLAAMPTVYLTAWRMLVTRARLRRGESLLIHSVGSGVGSAALRIARLVGARVFVTASSAAKLEKAKTLGAELALNSRADDVVARLREATDGKGVDVVLDAVGTATWETSLALVAKNGRVVTCGVTSGAFASLNLRALYQRQVTILGATLGSRAELETVVALALDGRLEPDIACVFPLSAIREAHRALEERTLYGKVVLRVGDEAGDVRFPQAS